ncbi:arylsulfatase [Cecembia sp.]|uniref:arylsulfatase n=1 Tax=Cecembia sp. TaxID=1898110 RepID=UPI0025C2E503|nr:arylsulfatase [Cecembia sp.]
MQANQFFKTHKGLIKVVTGISLLGFTGIESSTGAESVTSDIDAIRGSKPNIIFILADDMGYNDLSINGQSNFRTPALDRMVTEGIFLADHYAGSTVCAPSRAALLTGQHTGHVYQRGNGMIEFRPDPLDITIATRLQNAGYHTAMIGKSGVGCNSDNATLPNDKGFDHFFGFLAHRAAHRFYPEQLTRNGETISYPGNDGHTGELYSGDLFLDDALNYLDHQGSTDQPFFLHLAIQQPHADLSVPEEFRQPFIGQFEENPHSFGGYRHEDHPAATYAAMITYVDHTVRRVLQKLRELGIEGNTLVIFSSDNGSYSEGGYHYSMHDSNAPFRGGKRDLYDGGIRVPTIAWWPGTIEPGLRSNHISAFWDFAPTALELAGLPVPEEMDGISYLPTLLNRSDQQPQHQYLYWEFYERGGRQAIRYGEWKGIRLDIRQDRYGPIELYNIVDDPGETNNLAEQHPDIVARIAAFMEEAHEPAEFEGFRF